MGNKRREATARIRVNRQSLHLLRGALTSRIHEWSRVLCKSRMQMLLPELGWTLGKWSSPTVHNKGVLVKLYRIHIAQVNSEGAIACFPQEKVQWRVRTEKT